MECPMGPIATILRLFGRGLRHCLFLILMAFRVPVILILRGVGNLLLLATPVLGIFFYSSGLMTAHSPCARSGSARAGAGWPPCQAGLRDSARALLPRSAAPMS